MAHLNNRRDTHDLGYPSIGYDIQLSVHEFKQPRVAGGVLQLINYCVDQQNNHLVNWGARTLMDARVARLPAQPGFEASFLPG
jgi:hypothetical protein